MPLPAAAAALGTVARFLLAKGTREAVKKFGKQAVNKAKTELDDFVRTADTLTRQRSRQTAVKEGRIGQRTADTFSRQRGDRIARGRQAAVEEGRIGQRTADQYAKTAHAREAAIQESERMAGAELRRQAGPNVRPPTEGQPLKFKKGGSVPNGGSVPKTAKVRGAGKAIRGVRPAKLY